MPQPHWLSKQLRRGRRGAGPSVSPPAQLVNSQKRMKSGSAWRPPPTVEPVEGLMAASAQGTPTDTWQCRPQGKTVCGCDFISSYRARPRGQWAFWVPAGLWAVRPPRAGAPGLPRACSCLWAAASLPHCPRSTCQARWRDSEGERGSDFMQSDLSHMACALA